MRMDFWVGSALLPAPALFEILVFGGVFGAERGLANRASHPRIPGVFVPVIRYVCPAYLLVILGAFAYRNFPEAARAVVARPAALVTVAYLAAVLVWWAAARWERAESVRTR